MEQTWNLQQLENYWETTYPPKQKTTKYIKILPPHFFFAGGGGGACKQTKNTPTKTKHAQAKQTKETNKLTN